MDSQRARDGERWREREILQLSFITHSSLSGLVYSHPRSMRPDKDGAGRARPYSAADNGDTTKRRRRHGEKVAEVGLELGGREEEEEEEEV